jgi:hypothetical protein
MTIDEFRKMAPEIPASVELSHMNHPDFRVAGKVFASLGVPDESWGMVKLTPEQQRRFIEKAPEILKPCSGAWGQQGYTNVHLASAKASIVRAALDAAAKNVAAHAKKKKGSAQLARRCAGISRATARRRSHKRGVSQKRPTKFRDAR